MLDRQLQPVSSEKLTRYYEYLDRLIQKRCEFTRFCHLERLLFDLLALQSKLEKYTYPSVHDLLSKVRYRIEEVRSHVQQLELVKHQIKLVEKEFDRQIFRAKAILFLREARSILSSELLEYDKLYRAYVLHINYLRGVYAQSRKPEKPAMADMYCSQTKRLMLQPVLWQEKWYERCQLLENTSVHESKITVQAAKVKEIQSYLASEPSQLLQFLIDQQRIDLNYFFSTMRKTALFEWVRQLKASKLSTLAAAAILLAESRRAKVKKREMMRHCVNRIFPNLYDAKSMQNEHELDSSWLDQKPLLQAMRAGNYTHIAETPKAYASAIKLLRRSRHRHVSSPAELKELKSTRPDMTYEEASTMIEISDIGKHHGADNIEFHFIFDDAGVLTKEGSFYLKEMCSRWRQPETDFSKSQYIPAEYKGEKNRDFLLENYQALRSKLPKTSYLFYKIKEVPLYNKDRFLDGCLFHLNYSKEKKPCIYMPSFGTSEVLGKLLFGRFWVKKVFQVGISSYQGMFNRQLGGVRVSAVGPVPDFAHGLYLKPGEYAQHDEAHRIEVTGVSMQMRKALERIGFVLRFETGFDLSVEMETIINRETELTLNISDGVDAYEYMVIKSGTLEFLKQIPLTVAAWLVIMDMVDRHDLWEKQMGVYPLTEKFMYQPYVAQYQELMREEKFKKLESRQKVFILTCVQELSTNEKRVIGENLEAVLPLWERYQQQFVTPEAKDQFGFDLTNEQDVNFPINTLILRDVRSHGLNPYYMRIRERLEAKEVDVNAVNSYGVTLLHMAVAMGYQDLVAELLALGADIYLKSCGVAPMELAIAYEENDIFEQLRNHNKVKLSRSESAPLLSRWMRVG